MPERVSVQLRPDKAFPPSYKTLYRRQVGKVHRCDSPGLKVSGGVERAGAGEGST